jgi:TonB dependent receptor-like, beta-barrel/Carboxypeptidase regulatory-like domain
LRHLTIWLVVIALPARFAAAQPNTGVVGGLVTTQSGTVRLAGASVTIVDRSTHQVTHLVCREDSSFGAETLPPGDYDVTAALEGFVSTTVGVHLSAGKTVNVPIDLPIAVLSQRVEVTASSPVSAEGTLSPSDGLTSQDIDQFAPGGGLSGSLRLLASILEVPGGFSIKGGRPSQAGMQIGTSTLADTATGLSHISLPDDAIDSVAVLPNPYAVEYGRFSSGLVVIQTRRAADEWKIRLNSFEPAFRTKRGSPVNLYGVGYWAPRLEVGGPLVKDKWFLEQTAQFRYTASDVASLPPNELRVSRAFSSFTRVDGNLSSSQTLVATAGIFPGVALDATLGTFTPPPATVDLNTSATEASVTHRVVWSNSLFSETTVHEHSYRTDVLPQGTATMQLLPDTTLGNFFNNQNRQTGTEQIVETVSGTQNTWAGVNLFKLGVDVLHNSYDGESLSRTVLIERADGTLARRLDFSAPITTQSADTTDLALFAQDRLQPNANWYLELGARLDRDGVVGRFNVTPRIGTAVVLTPSGSAVVRGGFGLFYERTPSTAAVFDDFESEIDTRFAGNGTTPLGPPVDFTHVTGNLRTPRSRTWDVGYDYRFDSHWSFHATALDREGSHELIVNPSQIGNIGQLRLTSTGQSLYRGLEVGVHFSHNPSADFNASYTWSMARADLNSLTNYYDAVMAPVIGVNQYAPSSTDVPHRFTARGRVMPTNRWLLLGIFDWRTGVPYSIVDESLDFVGARDSERFPDFVRLEVGLERRFQVGKLRPWIGVRVWNALNAFLPNDVQANLGSPAFGSFYNSEYRQFRIQLRFER